MLTTHLRFFLLLCLVAMLACSEDEPIPVAPPPGITPPPSGPIICQVEEIEFRDIDDQIIGVREFVYNPNRGDRLESISIIENNGQDVVNLRFRLNYSQDDSLVPNSIEEILGADIVTRTDFKFDSDENLTEFTRSPVYNPDLSPENYIFFYEASELANDSINSRIVTFDIDRLTQEWIDVLPALFTTGGQRITRFDRVSFTGDLLEFCLFHYDDQGSLEEIVCRAADGLLTEVWNFTYENGRLVSAFEQLPNFRAIAEYQYDQDGKPVSVESSTNGIFNWSGRYFYLCR